MSKYCSRCGIEKTSDNTNHDWRLSNGLASSCRDCSKQVWLDRGNKKASVICKGCGKKFLHPGGRQYCPECVEKREKGTSRVCKICGKKFDVTTKYKIYCSIECRDAGNTVIMERISKPFDCITPGCSGRVTKEGIPCKECRKRIKSQKVVFLDLARKWFKPKKKEFESTATKFCRNCGKSIQNRGNSYDFCIECLPAVSTPIGFCRYCGNLFIRKGQQQQCPDCEPLNKRVRKKRGLDLFRTYKNNLKEKGCVVCGYNNCLAALEFHHIDQDKEVEISKIKSISRLRREIEVNNLVILCANCHREVHAGLIDDTELKHKKLAVKLRQAKLF